ncbi:MAG: AI-2E family transporter [Pyrinomonadaceae bacterium]|nr:AI-2E family transporter [Pyrinomonadaceae bacterium]
MTLTKVASLLLIITAVFALLILGKSLLIPFIIAILIWYVINALSHYFGEFKIVKKYLPTWASTLISGLVILFLLTLVGGLIAENTRAMVNELPTYEKNVGYLIERLGTTFNFDTSRFFQFSGSEKVPDLFGSVRGMFSEINVADVISRVLNALSGIAGNTFLVLIYVVFLFFEQAVFPKKVRGLFSQQEQYDQFSEILSHINEAIRAYFSVKLTVSLITGIASYILMALVGLDFAFFWAFLIFLLNFIPNIGSLIATVFPSMLALIQFETLTPFVIILVGVGAIQIIVGNLIEPRMMGSSLNISSLVVILALTLWGSIWGIAGMILCVPITVMLMIVFAQFPATRPIAILLSEKGELMDSLEEIHEAND